MLKKSKELSEKVQFALNILSGGYIIDENLKKEASNILIHHMNGLKE